MKQYLIILGLVVLFTIRGFASTDTPEARRASDPDAQEFKLDIEATGGASEIQLELPVSGKIGFSLYQPKVQDLSANIDFAVSQFIGEQGDVVAAKLNIPGMDESKSEFRGLTASPLLHVQLLLQNLPNPGVYRGRLFLTVNGKSVKIWRVAVNRPALQPHGTLVLDQQTVTLEVERPFLGWKVGSVLPYGSVRIWERTGKWTLHEIAPRLEEVTKAPQTGFDLSRNVSFKLDGSSQVAEKGAAFATINPAGWTVEAGHQENARLTFHELGAGEYLAKIRITAPDSMPDDAQKLTLVLHVRDSIWWAVGLLTFALLFSFVGTKFIGFQRERILLRGRIADIKQGWLGNKQKSLAEIWACALLQQLDDLCGRLWMTGTDVIKVKVTQAEKLIPLLEEVRKLRARIPELRISPIEFRVRLALEELVGRIDLKSLDDAALQRTEERLKEFKKWVDEPATRYQNYWDEVKTDFRSLLATVNINEFAAEHRGVVQELKDNLIDAFKNLPVPVDLENPDAVQKLTAIDYTGARLKILWERRQLEPKDDFNELVKLAKENSSPRKFFDLADQQAWKGISAACERTANCKKTTHPLYVSDLAEPEAFHPLVFRATTGNERLDRTYLFSYGLRYVWTCERRRWRWLRPKTSTIETDGPRMVEYTEGPGRFNVSVRIWPRNSSAGLSCGEAGVPGGTDEVLIKKSTDFQWLKTLNKMEVFSMILALIVGVVSGLEVMYLKNASFGTMLDYVSLFLWGVGVDQVRNALQVMHGNTVARPTGERSDENKQLKDTK